ncbi:uncharacterized protein LY89DRAFT_63125 [Mollisia scopiformis]|uniref:Uncharacterized protein n=1 Tax=Mollisia scopiformis TaxID=149040 RepID=A0A194X9B1_MOLSC|nr:uncharacterized protein LY89DRAFT_63125 [Mollisia scopiformis]KUJ16709.1 hypothetical protein LY89DRAFT_63125 [Mollisia scopiformis]
MKLLEIQAAIGTAILLLSAPCDAKLSRHLSHLGSLERRHNHHKKAHTSPRVEGIEGPHTNDLKKRSTCPFPSNAGLVAVTPGSSNGGWAMSPDQPCGLNSYCPYACPPGQVMAQWSPAATSYTYPESMAGGLYCDENGNVNKPFPSKEYCVSASGPVQAVNNCGSTVSYCQTVLPGNEAMLIPTAVDSSADLAVPGPSYWCSTAAHYYINPPGVDTGDACVWGDGSKPIGNWAPYVAGANTDNNGNTFVKIGLNPIWTGCDLSQTTPTFGVKIECVGGGCNGLPCSIDPSNGVGVVTSPDSATGAGGADFCVVTVPSGSTANIITFNVGGSSGSSNSGSSSAAASPVASSKAAPTPSPTPTPTPTPTLTPSPSSTSSTTSSSKAASSTVVYSSSSTWSSSAFSYSSSSAASSSTSASATADNSPHVFFQGNSTGTTNGSSLVTGTGALPTNPTSPAGSTSTKQSGASETFTPESLFGLIIMFAVAGILL